VANLLPGFDFRPPVVMKEKTMSSGETADCFFLCVYSFVFMNPVSTYFLSFDETNIPINQIKKHLPLYRLQKSAYGCRHLYLVIAGGA